MFSYWRFTGRRETIEIVQFHPRHLEVMEVRDLEASVLMGLDDAYTRIEELNRKSTQAVTFVCDGRILCCAGFFTIWPGVAEGWIIPSKYIKDYKIGFCRLMRNYIIIIMDTFRLHRFQTTSFDDEFHERWMRFMGFKKEGTMEKFTYLKTNQCMYAKVV